MEKIYPIAWIWIIMLYIIVQIRNLIQGRIQKKTLRLFNQALAYFKENEHIKIPTWNFIKYINENIIINQSSFVKAELKNFLKVYTNAFKWWISLLDLYKIWTDILINDIMKDNRDDNTYRAIKKLNKYVDDIEQQYEMNILNWVSDYFMEKKFFQIRLHNAMWSFLDTYTKNNDSLWFLYFRDFTKYLFTKFSKIEYLTWKQMEGE